VIDTVARIRRHRGRIRATARRCTRADGAVIGLEGESWSRILERRAGRLLVRP